MIAALPLSLQHKSLPLTAWIILAVIILFVLILNYSLFSALRKKDNSTAQTLQRFINSIKEPAQSDEKMRQELEERVRRLAARENLIKDE
jgi:predicted negative regulator of RcsB-dependent stress response